LPALLEAALAGRPLVDLVEADAFARDGRLLTRAPLSPEEQPICACMRIPRGTLVQLIKDGCRQLGELQARTRCGTVCGACVPSVAELLGDVSWTPVTIGEEIPLGVGIRSFRLVPTGGEALPSLPGQHLVVQAWIDGSWVQRSYTLSAARG